MLFQQLVRLSEKKLNNYCSNRINSVQRFRVVKSLQDFSWGTIIDEAAQHAPNLVHLLMECTYQKVQEKDTWKECHWNVHFTDVQAPKP